MKVDNILVRYTATPHNVSMFREMLLDEYFPRFTDFPADKIVEKAGEVFHEMVYLHSLLSLKVNPNFEIWEIAKWLSNKRYLYYSFVFNKSECGVAYRPLASYLGTAIYNWCKTRSMDETTRKTILRLFEMVEWEMG